MWKGVSASMTSPTVGNFSPEVSYSRRRRPLGVKYDCNVDAGAVKEHAKPPAKQRTGLVKKSADPLEQDLWKQFESDEIDDDERELSDEENKLVDQVWDFWETHGAQPSLIQSLFVLSIYILAVVFAMVAVFYPSPSFTVKSATLAPMSAQPFGMRQQHSAHLRELLDGANWHF